MSKKNPTTGEAKERKARTRSTEAVAASELIAATREYRLASERKAKAERGLAQAMDGYNEATARLASAKAKFAELAQ